MNRMKELQVNNLKEDEYYKLMIFFTNCNNKAVLKVKNYRLIYYLCVFLVIQSLGENLRLRQQVIASATIYFRRFYSKYSLKSIDPFLLAPTCLLLATKVEVFWFTLSMFSRIWNLCFGNEFKEFGLSAQPRFATIAASLSKFVYSVTYWD